MLRDGDRYRLYFRCQTPGGSSAGVVLVENGQARAVIVTADAPNPVAKLAAFAAARVLLDAARQAAETAADPVYARRVQFLEIGLRHAELAAEFIGTLRGGNRAPTDDPARFAAARKALQNLIAFRREHEQWYFSDLIAAAYSENCGLQIDELFDEGFVVEDAAADSGDGGKD